jgi:RNA polymerase sigma factor (sigma-70 family)
LTWLDEAQEIAHTVARQVHRKYHTYFDANDVKNELIVWVLRRETKVKEWLEHDKDTEDYRTGVRMLAKTLQRYAEKYCRRAKAQAAGYEVRDEFFYSAEMLEQLLPFAWKDVVPTSNPTGERVGGGGNPAEGGNYIISLFDVRKAKDKLEPDDQLLLHMKYVEAMTYEQISESLAISRSSSERKVKAALRRITRELGGEDPWIRKKVED